MKFSVIIPFLEERVNNVNLVLHSLAVQDFPMEDVEVVLVQDGGLDMSIKIDKLNLTVDYYLRPKYIRKKGLAPRNYGKTKAKADNLVFLDSDVLLRKDGLKYFDEDLTFNDNRIICGTYHWNKPMQITPEDIRERFDLIESEELPTSYFDGSHNVSRDFRQQFENNPQDIFYMKDGMHNFLACFGGLLCIPKKIFDLTGGFPNWLSAGLVDDGAAGLAWMLAGAGISFDNRVVGYHMYHSRNRRWVEQQSGLEAEELNAHFGLPPFHAETKLPEEIIKEYLALQAPETISVEVIKNMIPVKLEDNDTIYSLQNNIIKGIPDPETFFSLGFKSSDIQIVTKEELKKYKMAMPYMTAKRDLERKLNDLSAVPLNNGRVVKFFSNPTVYWEHEGKIRGIPDPETLSKLGFSFADVKDLPSEDLIKYKEMPPFASCMY